MPRLSEEELRTRRDGLGATDIVEILGLSPYADASPMRVYLEKCGEPLELERDEDALEWGHAQEPVILAWYTAKTGRALLPGGHVPHREIPGLWATLDAKASDRIVEAKNVGGGMARNWDVTSDDGVPRYVRAQCLIGQACLGVRLTDVVASLAGRPPHIWTVAWDGELVEFMLRRAQEFIAHVRKRIPPPLDASRASAEFLRRTWPSNEDRKVLPATEEMERLAAARMLLAQSEKAAGGEKVVKDRTLLDLIGGSGADGAEGDGWKMTWFAGKDGTRRQRFTARGEE